MSFECNDDKINREARAFEFDEHSLTLQVLDQTALPARLEFIKIEDIEQGYNAIREMNVRGAPCIAAVGCLSVVVELNSKSFDSSTAILIWLRSRTEWLKTSRPTAVNLKQALDRMVAYCESNYAQDPAVLKARITSLCVRALKSGYEANERLGSFGADCLLGKTGGEQKLIRVLTHCNTGSLATVGHGTALGVIRSLNNLGKLERVYFTETRPYNQGSRLTAWELLNDRLPATLIADNMVAYLMATTKIDAVIVGADRVAANGDTANKIGTLQIALIAEHYHVPFYVAAPTQTIDLETKSGNEIEVELRPADELRGYAGVQLAPKDVDVWNPCFDVTPSELITGIITEFGVCEHLDTESINSFLDGCPTTDVLF